MADVDSQKVSRKLVKKLTSVDYGSGAKVRKTESQKTWLGVSAYLTESQARLLFRKKEFSFLSAIQLTGLPVCVSVRVCAAPRVGGPGGRFRCGQWALRSERERMGWIFPLDWAHPGE